MSQKESHKHEMDARKHRRSLLVSAVPVPPPFDPKQEAAKRHKRKTIGAPSSGISEQMRRLLRSLIPVSRRKHPHRPICHKAVAPRDRTINPPRRAHGLLTDVFPTPSTLASAQRNARDYMRAAARQRSRAALRQAAE